MARETQRLAEWVEIPLTTATLRDHIDGSWYHVPCGEYTYQVIGHVCKRGNKNVHEQYDQ